MLIFFRAKVHFFSLTMPFVFFLIWGNECTLITLQCEWLTCHNLGLRASPVEVCISILKQQVGFFKKKPMKRSAAVCYKRFPFALDSSVIDSLVRH